MVTIADYKGHVPPDWCPGCGNYAQLSAISKVLSDLGIEPKDTLVSSGIGCSSNMPEFINVYGFHGIHGRALPVASAAKWANPKLTVLAYGGDGDGFSEGSQHLFYAAKRNVDITYIVSDNQIFGLTTGQASPTSQVGMKTKSTPDGNLEKPFNPLAFALTAGATFVARAFSGNAKHLQEIIKKGMQHKGFSFIDVFSPCVTYNKINTYDFFRQRTYVLEGNDTSDFKKALDLAHEWGDKIPIGVLYENNEKRYEDFDPVISGKSLIDQPLYKLTEEDLKEFL